MSVGPSSVDVKICITESLWLEANSQFVLYFTCIYACSAPVYSALKRWTICCGCCWFLSLIAHAISSFNLFSRIAMLTSRMRFIVINFFFSHSVLHISLIVRLSSFLVSHIYPYFLFSRHQQHFFLYQFNLMSNSKWTDFKIKISCNIVFQLLFFYLFFTVKIGVQIQTLNFILLLIQFQKYNTIVVPSKI